VNTGLCVCMWRAVQCSSCLAVKVASSVTLLSLFGSSAGKDTGAASQTRQPKGYSVENGYYVCLCANERTKIAQKARKFAQGR
jgi:hypothetical protein